jgi:hypothetical protein
MLYIGRERGDEHIGNDANACEFPRSPAPVPNQRARLRSIVINVDRSKASSIDNYREVGGSFERVIGPGSWHEPGLKVDL